MMHFGRRKAVQALTSTLLLGLISCGQIDAGEELSETKVTNGESAASEFPSVVMLTFKLKQGAAICTGTFVNDSQVITAAHCVHDLIEAGQSPSDMSFEKNGSNGTSHHVAALSLEEHPEYTVREGALSSHDLAIVTFPKDSAPATTQLYAAKPLVGQAFTIVGFGLNNYTFGSHGEQTGDGSGVKRKGQNHIAAVNAGMIRFYGVPSASDREVPLGQESASGSGDSGGPLLINGRLAGVTSGGGLAQGQDESGKTIVVKVSNYVDLHEAQNFAFLSGHLASASHK